MPNPASPVVIGLEEHEVVVAKNSAVYLPLPALVFNNGMVMSRWEFTQEERAAIAAGADLFVKVLTFGDRLQPMKFAVIDRDVLDLVDKLGLHKEAA